MRFPAIDNLRDEIPVYPQDAAYPPGAVHNIKQSTTFCFRMEGESMINAHIPDGALLIADRSVKPQSGMIVVAAVNGEYTVRRLVRTRKLLVLHADNPSFRPMPVTPELQLEIYGVVTAIIIKATG